MSGKTIPGVLGSVIKSLFGIAGALFLAFFVFGGVQYMTAGSDAKGVQKAKTTLVRAVAGLAVVLFSYTLLSVLLNLIQTAAS